MADATRKPKGLGRLGRLVYNCECESRKIDTQYILEMDCSAVEYKTSVKYIVASSQVSKSAKGRKEEQNSIHRGQSALSRRHRGQRGCGAEAVVSDKIGKWSLTYKFGRNRQLKSRRKFEVQSERSVEDR